ncbi:MAG TPA: Holliday junction resolvase RuvX [Microbacteriaceae bacterium]|nr:Holliday junction resolvase RuvX [Microbacteriaceae bacterium]
MRDGVRLALDVGTVRIGVARSDRHAMLASPLETIRRGDGDAARVLELVAEHDAIELYVGLPRALSGRTTASTQDAIGFARGLVAALGDDRVRFVDERLTTVSAAGQLHAVGKNAKRQRQVIDQVAATIILEAALDSERRTGIQPGIPVSAIG